MPHRWSDIANVRKNQIESGVDLTFVKVFLPIFIEIVKSCRPERMLEIGAGTGHLSLELSKHGKIIDALEPSQGMFNVAKKVLENTQVNLYKNTCFDHSLESNYNLVISHLCAHVIESFEDYLNAAKNVLKDGGIFFFSLPHPCFYNDYKKFLGSEYEYMLHMNKSVSFSITKDPESIISGVPYHHRPLSFYINAISRTGFLIEEFKEIFPPDDIQKLYGKKWHIPRYCTFTLKQP